MKSNRLKHSWLKKFSTPLVLSFVLLVLSFQSETFAANQCQELFSDTTTAGRFVPTQTKITAPELLNYVSKTMTRTEEFNFIRAEANRMGIRIWMFGGTAASYLHYVKWDLARQKGILGLQADRFDYDFTNIFRSTQDLDIVVDGTIEQIQSLQNSLGQKFPYFVGSKKAWEVRSLKVPIGTPGDGYYKEALLNDPNFFNQNTDTNSIAMVEISDSNEPIVRDLKAWTAGKNQFLEDALNNTISYLRNPLHNTTARAKMGQNPEILSVMRLLVKAFQYDLVIDPKSLPEIKKVIAEFNPRSVTDQTALRRMNETASKLVMHSSNIERAIDVLDQMELRQKLISMNLRDNVIDANLWLNKEPLRSYEITASKKLTKLPKYTSGLLKNASFKPTGKTAKDLNIQVVAHETNSFLAYESITRSHTGEPNVLISRNEGYHEAAAFGDGFYTLTGREGARGTGLTIRFDVDPSAREGADFTVHGGMIVFLNKKALRVIQESLNLGIIELVDMVEVGTFRLDSSDKGIFEKLKRRLNANRIQTELEKLMFSKSPKEQDKFEDVLISLVTNEKVKNLVASATITQVVKQLYKKIVILKDSANQKDNLKYIKLISAILPALIESQTLSKNQFEDYLIQVIEQGRSPELTSVAIIERALIDGAENFLKNLQFGAQGKEVKHLTIKKIKLFARSKDVRKQTVFNLLSEEKEIAFKENNHKKLKKLLDLNLIEINDVSISGHSLLLEAAYYEAHRVIYFLISSPKFNIDRKNKNGRNDVEELRLSRKNEIADYIEQHLGRIISKKIIVPERHTSKSALYPEGKPIIEFVRIEPGTFRMGHIEKVTVTLSKAFDMMSVDTTQRMWKGVVDLTHAYLPRQFNLLNDNPSVDKGRENPVENVSHDEITQQWLVALNQLSELKTKVVQEELAKLLPGHSLGKNYRLPTEAEWEYVSRLGGLATGNYAFGHLAFGENAFSRYGNNINQNSWSTHNTGRLNHRPVGQLKPIMINGKPLYDIHGNVGKFTQDFTNGNNKLSGGVDPIGLTGSHRVSRGGDSGADKWLLVSGFRDFHLHNQKSGHVGFRLVSDVP